MWDLGLYLQATESVVQRYCISGTSDVKCLQDAWRQVPDRLAFYDYLGHNPAKGGLFRTGPMVYGDGIIVGWLGQLQLLQAWHFTSDAKKSRQR